MEQKEIQEIGEKTAKKRPGKSKDMAVTASPEENKKYVSHVLESFKLPEIDRNDPDQVAERIEWYFNHCATDGMKPTVAGVCNALGIDRVTFYQWGTGDRRGKNPAYANMVKKAKAMIWELWEQYAADGKVNPVTFIFLMKNHFGYADKQEVVVTPSDPLGDRVNVDELQAKYSASVVDVEGEEVDA